MLNVKNYINELESRHPFSNKNIYTKCYQENEILFTIECYIGNTKLMHTQIPQATIVMAVNSIEWALYTTIELERKLKQIMERPFNEVLDFYYEQDASMEELNEIAKLWNDTKNFKEWLQFEREELGI